MLVIVDGLEWLVVAGLHNGIDGGGVCGRVFVGVEGLDWFLVVGCRLREVAG